MSINTPRHVAMMINTSQRPPVPTVLGVYVSVYAAFIKCLSHWNDTWGTSKTPNLKWDREQDEHGDYWITKQSNGAILYVVSKTP